MRLRDYYLVLRRRWWLPLLLLVLGTVAAFVFSRTQEPLYRSSITLRVITSRPDYGLGLAASQQLRNLTYAINEDMFQRISDELKLDLSVDQVGSRIKYQTVPEDLVIKVDVEDTDPNRARDIARVLGRDFEEQLLIQNANIDPNNRINVRVHNPPREGVRIRPQTTQNVIAGAMLGLLLGVLLAFVLEFLDDTLKAAEDVERYTSLPIIGAIPGAARGSGIQRSAGALLAGLISIRVISVFMVVVALIIGIVIGGRIA